MSEQDADSDGETAATEAPSTAGEQGDGESLDEIAEEPAGDIDELLSEITEQELDGIESETDEEAESSLVSVIETTPAEVVAAGFASLHEDVDELEAELEEERERADDLESRLKRKQADFQNYKKRQKERMEEEKQRATEDLVSRLLDVRDNLQRALEQDAGTDIRGGVESTLEQFNQELDKENVAVIEPDVGSEVDPRRHEVLATIASDQPEDTVADLHRPGYEMAGKVLRPAQVAVSDGSGHDSEEGGDGQSEEA
ncbi:nucleotide exchange factor GrpE [Halobacteriaceae archaeon SHR40]|uniref:nucleotide exchange factor GrpE n=1 Tax=Halovenus amylolytica TaxID=2500550 RepID=UPI000FE3EA99